MSWECRLCPEVTFTRAYMSDHLAHHHQIPEGLDGDLTIQLHASRDSPDSFENTYGYYDSQKRLLAIHVHAVERAADDPMRFS